MGFVLMGASIPCACIIIGLVNSATTLAATRFFIGLGGSNFVICQYWSTSMFTKEVAGTANALVTVTPIVHTCLSKVQGCHSLPILALTMISVDLLKASCLKGIDSFYVWQRMILHENALKLFYTY